MRIQRSEFLELNVDIKCTQPDYSLLPQPAGGRHIGYYTRLTTDYGNGSGPARNDFALKLLLVYKNEALRIGREFVQHFSDL